MMSLSKCIGMLQGGEAGEGKTKRLQLGPVPSAAGKFCSSRCQIQKRDSKMHLKKMTLTLSTIAMMVNAEPVAPPTEVDEALLGKRAAEMLGHKGQVSFSKSLSIADPTSNSGLTWVCGILDAGQLEAFMAILSDNPLSGSRQIHLFRIAETTDQVALVRQFCHQKATFSNAVDRADQDVRAALQRHSDLMLACLSEGPSSNVCRQREAVEMQVESAGFCIDDRLGWGLC